MFELIICVIYISYVLFFSVHVHSTPHYTTLHLVNLDGWMDGWMDG